MMMMVTDDIDEGCGTDEGLEMAGENEMKGMMTSLKRVYGGVKYDEQECSARRR